MQGTQAAHNVYERGMLGEHRKHKKLLKRLIFTPKVNFYQHQKVFTQNKNMQPGTFSLLTFVPGRQHLVPMFVAGRHVFVQLPEIFRKVNFWG